MRTTPWSPAIWPAVLAVVIAVAGCAESAPQVPPRQITEPVFQYPESLWDERIEGETLLAIAVSAQGAVDSAWVEQTSGYAEFDSAAVDGARLLRFEPASRDGEAVAVQVHLPVHFHLPDPDSTVMSETPPISIP